MSRPVLDVEDLIKEAEAHGNESDPDHEVGDLQALVRACWEELPADARARVWARHREMSGWHVDTGES